jgi:hypothetical protein
MAGLIPSQNPSDSTFLLPHILAPGGDGFSQVQVCVFVRRSDVFTFRQAWGNIAQERQIKMSLYAVPDRLTQHQVLVPIYMCIY